MSKFAEAFWNIAGLNIKIFAGQKNRLFSLFLLSILASFFAGAFGYFFLSEASFSGPISVAVVDLDDSFESRLILSSITDDAGQTDLIEFYRHSLDSANEALYGGSIAAIITLPENFGNSIISGENMPFTVTYNQNTPLLSALVRVSADAFADMLRSSQTAIYVTLNYAATQEPSAESYNIIFTAVNMRFLSLVLSRGLIFTDIELSATGGLPIWQSYFIAAYIALMLCVSYVMTDTPRKYYNRFFLLSIKNRGLSVRLVHLALIAAYFALILALNIVLLILPLLFSNILGVTFFEINPAILLSVIIVTVVLSAFAAMLVFAFNSTLSAGAFTAVFAAVSLFLSGGIIPSEFFSDGFRAAANLSWSTWGVRLISAAWLGENLTLHIIANMLFGLAFALIGYLASVLRGRAI